MAETTNINGYNTIAGYWEWEVGNNNVTVDSSLKTLLGYDINEVPDNLQTWQQLVKPQYIDSLCKKYTEHIESNGRVPFVTEIGLANKTGLPCSILVTGRVTKWSSGNQPVKMDGSYMEVTPFKEAEKELQKVKDLLTKTSQTALVGGWELDIETKKLVWTSVTKSIFEVPDSYVPSLKITPVFFKDPKERARLNRAINRAITRGIPYDMELKTTTATGKEIWTRTVGHPEFVDGECVRLYGVFQNINRRKLAEQALQHKNAQLQKAVTEKLDFLSIMSHEIRTPMNAVIGFTNLLLQNPREDQLEYLNVLKFSAENLLLLINDILDYNKIDSGKIEFENIDFDLRELLKNIKSAQQQEADKKDLQLHISVDPKVPNIIKGDPTRMGQIITNLVANAIKFTPSGKIEIIVKNRKQMAHKVRLYFEVNDTGIGVPEDKWEYIFEKFSQATSETTRKYGGTGLGLAIIKKLLEMVGSKIRVRSIPGKGSAFFFELEFKQSRVKPKEVAIAPPVKLGEELAGKHILVVEDNPINVLVIKKFLQQWKIEYDVAQNGLIAVDKATHNHYDLILMDLQMPEMDGYDATAAIRKLSDKHRQLPILALTASLVEDMKEKVLEAGMNECVTKPFKPDELFNILSHYLKNEGIAMST